MLDAYVLKKFRDGMRSMRCEPQFRACRRIQLRRRTRAEWRESHRRVGLTPTGHMGMARDARRLLAMAKIVLQRCCRAGLSCNGSRVIFKSEFPDA
jgi:hypothetical protein